MNPKFNDKDNNTISNFNTSQNSANKTRIYNGKEVVVLGNYTQGEFHYIPKSVTLWLKILGVITFFAFIIMIVISNSNIRFAEDIKDAQKEHANYINMINYAEEQRELGNENYFVEATVIDYKLDYKDKYYINFEYQKSPHYTVQSFTHSIYSIEDAERIAEKGTITIVVNDDNLLYVTKQVEYDYKNVNIYQDDEYISLINAEKNFEKLKTISIIGVSCLGGALLLLFILNIKKAKPEILEEKPADISPSTSKIDEHGNPQNDCLDCELNEQYKENNATIYSKPTTKYCMYCGGKVDIKETKCPHCEAKFK